MPGIVHLSDLHFGRTRPEVLTPLLSAVAEVQPDLVVISGDLTQRARTAEFRAARAFLDRLPAPWLAVPGNHDVPLYNLGDRLLRPYARYRKWISPNLGPKAVTDTVAVAGMNTVDPRRHQRGKIRTEDIDRLCATFDSGPSTRLNIAFGHHPFEQGAAMSKAPTKHAGRALGRLSDCGAHVILSGHLHLWHAGPFLTGARDEGPIQIHSGTSLSSRLRGTVNDFAHLTVEPERLGVTRMVYEDSHAGFRPADRLWFRRRPAGLSLIEDRSAA